MSLEDKCYQQIKEQKEFVCVYTDNYSEEYYGYVVDYNLDFLVFVQFNEDGIYDGVCILFRENISRVRWGGNEIDSMAKLAGEFKPEYYDRTVDISSVDSIINSVNELYGHLTVHIQDIDSSVCYIGQVEEVDGESLLLHEYGTRMSLDRKKMLLHIADITLIEADGIYERSLKSMFES